MAAPSCPALLATCLALLLATAQGDGCSSFGNVFTEIAENSAHGSLVARLPAGGDTPGAPLQLCLIGHDAAWFYLDGRSLRLNVSNGRALDREELESPVLMVALTCAEDGFSPVEYRIIVQVLNENDNRPHFQGTSDLTHNVSELAAVHSVVFSAQAEDADGDTLMYVIDTASPDARFFRIDLPNSGKVVLARALDFESRQQLEVVVTAVEMNTRERFNASARVRVQVLDGDDQYPQFLPCAPRTHRGLTLCTSPVYTANVTEGQLQRGPLSFSPGDVYAEDGDRGLRAAITYSLLAGQESSRFHIDNMTGAITLLRAVESSRRTPAISLSIMASQVNDVTKFAVAQAVVRVLAPNRHPPRFPRASFRAFVPAGAREAALLLTYGGRVLALRARDPDFPQGVNPQVRYSLSSSTNHSHSQQQDQHREQGQDHSQLFQVMPNGLVVARADLLQPAQHYRLQVLARDEESGETSSTTVELEVLWPGQAEPALVPAGPRRQILPDSPQSLLPQRGVQRGGLGPPPAPPAASAPPSSPTAPPRPQTSGQLRGAPGGIPAPRGVPAPPTSQRPPGPQPRGGLGGGSGHPSFGGGPGAPARTGGGERGEPGGGGGDGPPGPPRCAPPLIAAPGGLH
ncbi:cadherin-related family member 5-like isoform 3-T3 [Guaruba guarouba]